METFKISVSSGILSVTYKCDIYTIIWQLNMQARTLFFSNMKGWYLQHLPGHLLTPVEKHHSQCVGGDRGHTDPQRHLRHIAALLQWHHWGAPGGNPTSCCPKIKMLIIASGDKENDPCATQQNELAPRIPR